MLPEKPLILHLLEVPVQVLMEEGLNRLISLSINYINYIKAIQEVISNRHITKVLIL